MPVISSSFWGEYSLLSSLFLLAALGSELSSVPPHLIKSHSHVVPTGACSIPCWDDGAASGKLWRVTGWPLKEPWPRAVHPVLPYSTMESSPAEKDWWVKGWRCPWKCQLAAQKAKSIFGCIQSSVGRGEGSVLVPAQV